MEEYAIPFLRPTNASLIFSAGSIRRLHQTQQHQNTCMRCKAIDPSYRDKFPDREQSPSQRENIAHGFVHHAAACIWIRMSIHTYIHTLQLSYSSKRLQ
uniref:Uncharacterized protein n=1 Tax=Oryza brachyantha TaxID=4533 RepID=J3MHR4_ORYBR